MDSSSRCPHGYEVGVYRGPDVAMAAPYSTCECCQTIFFYIDGGDMTLGSDGERREERWVHDKSRCPDCGGMVTHETVENGRVVLSEQLSP